MSRHSYLNTYTPHFARHLHGLAISGFYARELDADDHDFIEHVKTRGIANGTLANTNAVLIEELEYWHLPYAIDWTIKRTHGPVPTRGKGETPEARQARVEAWRKRNAVRLASKKVADAEMAREHAEYEAANARRKHREIFGDAEWAAADPNRKTQVASGKVSGKVTNPWRRKLIKYAGANSNHARFYTPQWKLDELQAIDDAKREEQAAKQRARRALRLREEAEAQLEAVKREAAAREADEKKCAAAAAIAATYNPTEVKATKNAIAAMIRMSYPAVWTPERLTTALGLSDVQFVVHCAEEMVRDGQLTTAKTKERVRA